MCAVILNDVISVYIEPKDAQADDTKADPDAELPMATLVMPIAPEDMDFEDMVSGSIMNGDEGQYKISKPRLILKQTQMQSCPWLHWSCLQHQRIWTLKMW